MKLSDAKDAVTKHNLKFEGWNFQAHRELPGKSESSNVSRDDVIREIGRSNNGAYFCLEAGRRQGRSHEAHGHPLPAAGRSAPVDVDVYVCV